MRYVRIAPRGAAKEKINNRFRIIVAVRCRDNSVVVRPRAVGPVAMSDTLFENENHFRLTFMHQNGQEDDQTQTATPAQTARPQGDTVRCAMYDHAQRRIQTSHVVALAN